MLERHTCNQCVECVPMQVVTCQWTVVIQLLEFHNPMNIETKKPGEGNIQYCCCDTEETCKAKNAFLMKQNNCTDQCDISFDVSLYDGNSGKSSISTIKGTIQDSPPDSRFGYTFSFTLHDFPSSVRSTQNFAIFMCLFENTCTCFSLLHSSKLQWK